LNRSETSIFPLTPMVEFQHCEVLRCVHFPPSGTIIIAGGQNPMIANEGLPNHDPRRRGGMSGGGMSFHLRIWDFNLDAVLNPMPHLARARGNDLNGDARALHRGGKINDKGELELDYMADNPALKNPQIIIPRVLLYNDGGFDVSRDAW
jgi:activator-of-BECN1-regulated-autophagy protein 1